MADRSSIAWCDATWNPFRGCSRVSPGCQNCYAERMCARGLPGLKSPRTGEDFAVKTPGGPRWAGHVGLIDDALSLPLRWRKPRRIFVNSMSDTFHEAVPDWWIDRVLGVAARCPQHTFILPTKRVGRMKSYFAGAPWGCIEREAGCDIPPERIPLFNVILLASVEDNARADERIPALLTTPAAVRGISLEPMLGPVDLWPWLRPWGTAGSCMSIDGKWWHAPGGCAFCTPALDWVIVGGESGPGARPCQVEWIRDVVRQCREAGVPCFVKQVQVYRCRQCGACFEEPQDFGHEGCGSDDPTHDVLPYLSKNPAEWPEDLRVQQWPEVARG